MMQVICKVGRLWATCTWTMDVCRFPTDVAIPTSCAFGDADLRTLYVTTARQRLDDSQLRAEPDAGALFAIRTDVGGLPEPRCGF